MPEMTFSGEKPEAGETGRSRLRVLIVDDEAGMRKGVERALQNYIVRLPEFELEVDFVVSTEETAEQALVRIAKEPPDILLLDHKLPGISGLDLLSKLAGSPTDFLTIIITAYASLDTAVRAGKLGAYDFLAKPFTPQELRAVIYKTAKHLLVQRHARQLAEERRRMRFQFLSVLAHELKAPLAAVEQYLEILSQRLSQIGSSQDQLLVERSRGRLHGMRKLILDLLDLTRIESGEKKRELRPLDLCLLTRDALDLAATEAQRHNIRLLLEAPDHLEMKADQWEIETILNNLISNAVKYNREGGEVRVQLRETEQAVLISVADTGIGIAPDDAKKLFQEFVRIRSEQTEHILGSGLGLSIVKKIVSLYGGEISLVSRLGEGSVFTVNLPRPLSPESVPARQT